MAAPQYYFCDFSYGTQTKNKLQDEFSGFLKILNGHLYTASDFPKLKEFIIETATELNAKYSRCKPLKVVIKKECHSNDYYLFLEFATVVFREANIYRM